MDTLVLKSFTNATGILPKVGFMSVKFLGQGDRSRFLPLTCRGQGIVKIEGGFIVLDDLTEVTEKEMNPGQPLSLNVKVTGEFAIVHFPRGINGWIMKEWYIQGYPKTENTPIMDLTSRIDNLSWGNTSMFIGVNLPNRPINGLNLSSIVDFSTFFAYNPRFNQNVHNIGIINAVNMNFMLADCVAFNGRVDYIVTTNTTNTAGMFENDYSFNQPLVGWDMRNNYQTTRMLRNCILFDQDISNLNWHIESDFTQILDGCGLGTVNYGKFLAMLDAKFDGRSGVKRLEAWGVKYASGQGKTARTSLINKGWTIVDGGELI